MMILFVLLLLLLLYQTNYCRLATPGGGRHGGKYCYSQPTAVCYNTVDGTYYTRAVVVVQQQVNRGASADSQPAAALLSVGSVLFKLSKPKVLGRHSYSCILCTYSSNMIDQYDMILL